MKNSTLLIAASAIALIAHSHALCERVGYSFTGTLNVPSGPTKTWFGEPLDTPTPVVGTFSYDTTANGIDTSSADGEERTFRHWIEGGFTLEACFGTHHVVVESSDYDVRVRNNFWNSSGPDGIETDTFLISYGYLSGRSGNPRKLKVNGAEWSGPVALMFLAISWDHNTFSSETVLERNRPLEPNHSNTSYAGSQVVPSFVNPVECCLAIIPPAGDYNYDAKVDANDYVEWRKAFGQTEPQYLYADGNRDGIVDGGDYVIWRRAIAAGYVGSTAIPEPFYVATVTGLVLAIWSVTRWQRGVRRH